MVEGSSIRQTGASGSPSETWTRCLPELLAAGLVLLVGLAGWEASLETRRERLSGLLAVHAERYLDRLEHELVGTGDAFARAISASRPREGDPDAFDAEALNRHLAHDRHRPEIGRGGLAVPLSTAAHRPFTDPAVAAWSANTRHRPARGALRFVTVRDEVGGSSGEAAATNPFEADDALESALRARDAGRAVLHTGEHPAPSGDRRAAWLFAPLYAVDTPWSVQDRHSQFVGIGFAPIDLAALAERVASGFPELSVVVRLGGARFAETAATRSPGTAEGSRASLTVTREMLGRSLAFEIEPTPVLASAATELTPMPWLVQGFVASALLLLLGAWRGTRSQRMRRELLERIAVQSSRSSALERENADLESFAYVVAHDLKTPLRKTRALMDLLAEDLASADALPRELADDTDDCLRRLREQTSAMDALIVGIHEYSTATDTEGRVETIDTRACLETVIASIGVPRERLRLNGDFPTIRTWPVRFEQTLANLIGNAFKYHDRPEEASIEVSVSGFGDYCLFSVRDDGPGIDPSEHERIFEVFESIRVPGVESTGIGLSIVRRAVEGVGGQLTLESVPGAGSVFRFTWPKDIGTVAPAGEADAGSGAGAVTGPGVQLARTSLGSACASRPAAI